MSQTSPTLRRSTYGPHLRPSQASFCSTTRQPVKAGINAEAVQKKASRMTHSGFRGKKISDHLRKKTASISCIRWKCPPKFILNKDWQVVAGDQSEESRVQKLRESGITEVVYAHPSAIPSSPSISKDVKAGRGDYDYKPPIIPTTPIEDEVDPSYEGFTETSLEADIGAAASAAFTAPVKSNAQGSLIDADVLIKIFSDPKMIELLKLDAWSVDNEKAIVKTEAKQENLDKQSALKSNDLFSSVSRDRVKEESIKVPAKMQVITDVPESMNLLLSNSSSVPSVPQPPSSVLDSMLLPKQVFKKTGSLKKAVPKSEQPIKDANYYKSLIRQYGVDRREPRQFGNQISLREHENLWTYLRRQECRMPKASSRKPCKYFNSPMGCRNGLSCRYKHEVSFSRMRAGCAYEPPSAKRIKHNREVAL